MDIFSTELRMVRLTTLPEDLCSKFGTIYEQDKIKMVVNTKVNFSFAFYVGSSLNIIKNL